MWVMIVIVWSFAAWSPTAITAEFNSKAQCENVRAALSAQYSRVDLSWCVEK
jgi:hypothetical protein